MTLIETSTLMVLFSPFWQLFLHALSARIYKKKSPQIVVSVTILVGGNLLGALLWHLWQLQTEKTSQELFISMTYFLLGYFAVAYAYFNLFNISETGRRLKILYEILQAGTLTEEKLIQIYGRNEVVQIRLERLCAMGQLEKTGDSYRLKSRLLLFAGRCTNFCYTLLGFNLNP